MLTFSVTQSCYDEDDDDETCTEKVLFEAEVKKEAYAESE